MLRAHGLKLLLAMMVLVLGSPAALAQAFAPAGNLVPLPARRFPGLFR